jgi:DNA invertase Pin-like site-specific DNA recombinase
MMLTVLGAVAEFERTLMLERQREGIAKAKAEGRYRGREPTARAKAEDVWRLHGQAVRTEIAKRLGIGRASVYRLKSDGAGASGSGSNAATRSRRTCIAESNSKIR